jgi:hypothetical protein
MTAPSELDSAEINAAFRRLRALEAELGPKPNKHDLAITLISACILEGIGSWPRIVGALKRFALNSAHVNIMLNEGEGADPAHYRWVRGPEGRYSLLG